MKVIIVGCGNVGATLAEQLSKENQDITILFADIGCGTAAVRLPLND